MFQKYEYVIEVPNKAPIKVTLRNPVGIGQVVGANRRYYRVKDIWHSEEVSTIYADRVKD
ncbi:hypothetical protein ACNO5M_17420 [Vibrio owensii]|uniref:hypothetical protein n=1 Tax=Vibrio harveyi group TaxID=717610 RepID=UPI000CE44CC4|nr:hypothetical protein [Vibrio jasicida]